MTDRVDELRAILAEVRARWQRQALLRAWTLGAATAAAMLLVGVLAVWLVAPEGIPVVFAASTAAAMAVAALVFALLPTRQPPGDRQIARFIEERAGGLDEVLVTAVDKSESVPGPVTELLIADAIRAARSVESSRIITPDALRRAAIGAAAGSAAFVASMWVYAPSAGRALDVAGSYLFPSRYAIEVVPGSVKVREGQPVTVVARIPGIDGGLVPMLTVGRGDAARSTRMLPGAADEFTFTLNNITVSFPYSVTAGAASSGEFSVDVIRPVKVTRIDLAYDYPDGVGLAPHTEADGGDIFAPAGTKVRLTVTTDKSVTSGRLTTADGQSTALNGHNQVFETELMVARDGSYRIAVQDVDGLTNEGDPEYFIRMLNDRPPDVRILRPAGDRQVSPLEEVVIEARADDDYGVRSLELVLKANTGQEKVIPLEGASGKAVAAGDYTVFLEDLNVKPGDVVTYHARATDVGRGRRSTESRSDIFFLEVKPYEEEFVAAESNAAGMAGGAQTGLEELIAQQKDIMAATWKLDARARRGGPNAKSPADIKALAAAQNALKDKTDEIATQMTAQMAQQRRRLGARAGLTRPGEDPLPRAAMAMGRAATELDRLNLTQALPQEEQALAELLKAAAEIRRRQIAMQQARGGGGNGNRNQPDLSTLFDQELRKRQQTNYETQSTTQEANQQDPPEQDPLEAIRELARRQEALSKQQRDLARNQSQMSAEETKRQLERLTREQEQLRQQAEELSKRMQGQSSPGGQGSQRASGGDSQQLRDISEEMRNAAADLRRQDPQQASARGSKAGERLRGLEQRMQGSRPEERRRAMGDMQLEARQLADAERRLGNEAARTQQGTAGEDARRRLAAEQERLADRTERLGESVRQLAESGTDPDERHAMSAAGREMDQQKLAERMRESAQAMRQGQSGEPQQQAVAGADELARALDKVAERLGAATGSRDGETTRLSDQLSRAQELRDRLGRLQRSMDELQKQADSGQPGQPGQPSNGKPGSGQQSSQGQEGTTGQQGSAEGGRGGTLSRLQRDVDDQFREAQKLAESLQRDNPDMQKGGTTPEQWQRSVSAPGTEAFKQDFSKWESLKKNLLTALEQTESQLSEQLRARETRERLNAGRHDAVADTYRELVDRYYQSLAAPRRAPR
jgi:hypothetical protein